MSFHFSVKISCILLDKHLHSENFSILFSIASMFDGMQSRGNYIFHSAIVKVWLAPSSLHFIYLGCWDFGKTENILLRSVYPELRDGQRSSELLCMSSTPAGLCEQCFDF